MRINVIFRGSESKSDWYYDLKIFKHKLEEKYQSDNNDVYVHLGFYEQLTKGGSYNKILTTLKEALSELENQFSLIT